MKILFITSSRLGDAVISLSSFEAIRQASPENARFTVVCGPAVASLFCSFPEVETVISFHKKTFKRHWYMLWKKCVKVRWFLIVDLRGSPLSFLLRTSSRKIFRKGQKQQPRFLEQLKKLKLPTDILPHVEIAPEQKDEAAKWMGHAPYIALAPTAGSPQKCWPIENFIQLGIWLREKGFRLALFYGAGEHEFHQVEKFLKYHKNILNLGGGKDLGFIAACLEKCICFIGNDSGLMHLAAALDVPTCGMFGPSYVSQYAPRGVNVTLLEAPGDKGSGVMSLLSVERVQKIVMMILSDLEKNREI